MALMERWGKYWVCYYGVFLAVLVLLVARYWYALDWQDESWLPLLAAIFGVSAGMALTITIIAEGIGTMVLLIPKVAEKLRAEGRAEGLAEGEAKGLAKGEAIGEAKGLVEGEAIGEAKGLVEGEAIGLAKGRAEARAWLERKAAAERAGLPFDEPPPG